MPCLKPFISSTMEGNRNSNMFKAINHIRFHNPRANKEDLFRVSLEVNECLRVPLSADEVRVIALHTLKQPYRTTCKHFINFCKKCRFGNKKPRWRDAKGYWKVINKKNRVDLKYVTPKGMELYLWDIIDTSELTEEDKMKVMLLRESKGIDPLIDEVIKGYGVPVGDAALQDYLTYKNND